MVLLSVDFLAVGALLNIIFSSGLLLFGRSRVPSKESTVLSEKAHDVVNLPLSNNGGSKAAPDRARAGSSKRLIPLERLEKSKKELRTLLVEKELVSAALTRLFEAEAAGEITKEERELLGQKYRDELKTLNGKISQIDAFIEVGDLETLRDQLFELVREKVDAIERRIERTQKFAEPLIKEMLSKGGPPPKGSSSTIGEESKKEKTKVPDVSDLLEKNTKSETIETPEAPDPPPSRLEGGIVSQELIGKKANPEESDSDGVAGTPVTNQKRKPPADSSHGQVEELQRELLEALDRLEKMDVEAS